MWLEIVTLDEAYEYYINESTRIDKIKLPPEIQKRLTFERVCILLKELGYYVA